MGKGLERREFLKVIGVGGAGGLAGCASAGDTLISYVQPHEEIVPGMSTWYRTTCRECPAGCGMSVRTREGRAIKAEGNPLSPISHGRLCPRGQASLHGLYNPDRVPQALQRNGDAWDRVTWDDAERTLAAMLQQHRGRSVFITEHYTGSMDALVDDFCAALGVQRIRYEPFAHEALRAGSRMVYGQDAVPVHDFANADVVITFGADFLETWLSPVDYHVGFVQARAYNEGRRGKLIAVSPHQSLTDMNADEWVPIRPGTEHLVALALARLVADNGGQLGGAAAAHVGGVQVEQAAQIAGVSTERLRQIAFDFANGGRSLAVGPGVASSHGAATHVAVAVAALNQAAGNVGTTVRVGSSEVATAQLGTYAAMQQLVEQMHAGEIGAVLVHGPNPLYSLPDRERVRDAFERVPFRASFSPYLDETSERAQLLLPDHHFLESWGDYVPRTGITSLIQPVMTPVFDTKQTADVLLAVARRADSPLPNDAPTYYDYLRGRWQQQAGLPAVTGGFDEAWREALKIGVIATPAVAALQPAAQQPAQPQAGQPAVQQPAQPQAGQPAAQQPAQPQAGQPAAMGQLSFEVPQFTGPEDGYYLVVYPSHRFYDGRLANRPWLQELPDPVSKFCWSSWVEVNPVTADRLRLDTGHIVEVETPHGAVELPVWRHPGTLEDVIAIQLGQGHEAMGPYAQRGVNATRLLGPVVDATSGGLTWFQTRATIRRTGRWSRPIQAALVNDQHGRGIARALPLEQARAADHRRGFAVLGGTEAAAHHPAPVVDPHDPHYEPHPQDDVLTQLQGTAGWSPSVVDGRPQGFPPPGTHYGEYSEDRPRWGMAIDLERCTGCSACVTACYAENNIGIVGPEGVAAGRILNWMRIERYFEGHDDTLETRFLPMLCQHCNNAPCEPVCPVFAAYHTPDGLNAQVYNRCVGTRYCANNCPYKVRVFNWFSYSWPEPLNWQLNPDVTVREKGVMEKCTFCVQRIREAENVARMQDRGTRDGEIVPACAQTCPGDAIVFGNVKDPNSRVARLAASGRGYRVLQGLNTQSAITYLQRISEHATAEEH